MVKGEKEAWETYAQVPSELCQGAGCGWQKALPPLGYLNKPFESSPKP